MLTSKYWQLLWFFFPNKMGKEKDWLSRPSSVLRWAAFCSCNYNLVFVRTLISWASYTAIWTRWHIETNLNNKNSCWVQQPAAFSSWPCSSLHDSGSGPLHYFREGNVALGISRGLTRPPKISGFLAEFFVFVLPWSFSFQKYSGLLNSQHSGWEQWS